MGLKIPVVYWPWNIALNMSGGPKVANRCGRQPELSTAVSLHQAHHPRAVHLQRRHSDNGARLQQPTGSRLRDLPQLKRINSLISHPGRSGNAKSVRPTLALNDGMTHGA